MRRLWSIPAVALLAVGCHAHTTAAQNGKEQATMEKPPEVKQVSSGRPVRTTPAGMLDEKSMHKLQAALDRHGFKTSDSGQLDQQTEAALRKYQEHEHMPGTGLPDYDTLRRLGLDPKQIYLGGTERRDEQKQSKSSSKASNEAKR